MKRSRILVSVVVATLWIPFFDAVAQDRAAIEALKGQGFRLKTHEEAFGRPKMVNVGGRANVALRSSVVKLKQDAVTISGAPPNWKEEFFVSKKEFRVQEVVVDQKANEVRLQLSGAASLLQLRFKDIDAFDALFGTLFFRGGEDPRPYENAVRAGMVTRYIDRQVRIPGATAADKLQMLFAIERLETGGRPTLRLEQHPDGVYVRVPLRDETLIIDRSSEASWAKMNRDRRIQSSMQSALSERATRAVSEAGTTSTLITGYTFVWSIKWYMNDASLNEEAGCCDSGVNKIAVTVRKDRLAAYFNRESGMIEMLRQSLLNGKPYKSKF